MGKIHRSSVGRIPEPERISFGDFAQRPLLETPVKILKVPEFSTLYDHTFSLEIRKVRENNLLLPKKEEEMISAIYELCGEGNGAILDDILADDDFNVWYDIANRNTANRLYTDHGKKHAIWTTRYALEMAQVLARTMPMKKVDRLAIMVAAMVHDIGNSIAREGHNSHSCWLAKGKIENMLSKYYPIQRSMILTEILRCIYYHDKDAGECDDLKSAIVRVADGVDCSIDRVGFNGEKTTTELFGSGQVLHIKGKVPIKSVEISSHQGRVMIIAHIDPDFTVPGTDLGTSSCMHALEKLLYQEKIQTVGKKFRDLFQIWYEIRGKTYPLFMDSLSF